MHFSISSELEQKIARQAQETGFASVEEFLNAVLRTNASEPDSLSDAEFLQLLDELASTNDLPRLPQGFSRADIYADHD